MRLCVSGLLLVSCAQETTSWKPPNIVLISIDTLRADRLSIYGYPRETSPRITELAAQSAVFDRAYTQAPHTLAAHASLMTGQYPGRHGVLEQGNSLAPEEVTLAEMLSEQGYRSLAFVNALYLAPEFRMNEGFAVYDYANDVSVARNGEETNTAILEHLRDGSEQPLFLFAHYFDAHSDWEHPYEAPPAYLERFAGPPPPGYRPARQPGFGSREMLQLNRSREEQLTDAEVAHIGRLYDAGVAYTDAQVGALLDSLEEIGLLSNSIVILTSDHGEEFMDHGELLHGQIYEELVRIPMLVSVPEMRGSAAPACRRQDPQAANDAGRARRVSGLIQLADVLPTIAECLGIEAPLRSQGQSFLGLLAGGESERRHAYFEAPTARQEGILRDPWKLIEADGRGPRLYDLSQDPQEQHDLSSQRPEVVAELASELARYREENARTRSPRGEFAVPPDVQRALEALGYAPSTEPR
jgi:arylsulfatase A-like enzyme